MCRNIFERKLIISHFFFFNDFRIPIRSVESETSREEIGESACRAEYSTT